MTEHNYKPADTFQERILVIDDSPIIRNMLVDILSDEGYTVDTAEDGELGTEQALAREYVAIICDVHMPRKNGMETVRAIMEKKPESKIIMTDSYPDKLAQSARAEGALSCLQKPFDVKELRDLIRQVKMGGAITIGR